MATILVNAARLRAVLWLSCAFFCACRPTGDGSTSSTTGVPATVSFPSGSDRASSPTKSSTSTIVPPSPVAADAAPATAPSEEKPRWERPPKPCKVRLTPSQVRRELADLGHQALAAIERDDAQGFARLVHPTYGLDLGLHGTVKHHLETNAVRDAFRNDSPRDWSGRSTAHDGPFSLSLREFFAHLRRGKYTKAELVGYGKVVQEDNLCGRTCIAEAIENEFPCAPFIQYVYPTRSEMWRFLAVAFDRDTTGWHVIGLLEDEWSP